MNETESSVWLAHFRAELLVHCVKLGFYFDNSANTLAGHDFYSGLVLPFYRMFYSERMVVLLGVFMRLGDFRKLIYPLDGSNQDVPFG